MGTELDTDTGKFITFDAGWEAGVDSFIEAGLTNNKLKRAPADCYIVPDQDLPVRPH